jgi:hypothetical protein
MSETSNEKPLIGAKAIEKTLAEIGFPAVSIYDPKAQQEWGIGRYRKFLITTEAHLRRRARQIVSPRHP